MATFDQGRIRHDGQLMHYSISSNGLAVTSNWRLTATGDTGVTWAPDSNSTLDLGWFNVEAYGAVHDGTTDDTVAIQAAITACCAAGGGTIYLPRGIYLIGGALQSTSTYNSQLTIPNNPGSAGTEAPIAIRFLGSGPNAQSNDSPLLDFAPSNSGAILKSNWNGTISGSPAVISAGGVNVLYPDAAWNWTQVTFEDVEVRCHADPKLSGIQMRAAAALSLRHVTVSTDTSAADAVLPTHSNAVGVDQPYALNSNWPDQLEDVFIDGFYYGLRPSEQSNGDVAVAHCTVGVRLTGGSAAPTYLRHANGFGRLLVFSCKYGIVADGDQRWITIRELNIEHDTGTFATTYDIDDASNYLRGFIGWHTTDYTTGPEDNLLVNGGTGLSLHGFYAKRWKLNNVVEIPTGTDPSTNAATGGRLYAASATGHPTWRDSAGTVTDLLPSSSSGQHILLADGHATPFAFSDLLQMDDGSDFMWSDS